MADSDTELLRDFCATGGDAPFREIVRRHAPMVLGICRAVTGNAADAEDAAQAVFFTLAQKSCTMRGDTAVAGWLHRVAWHVAMRARKARQRRKSHERQAAMSSAQSSSHEQAASNPMLFLLNHELDRMPDRYRVPLILHHMQGLTEAEAASRVGVPVGTLSGRLTRGRQMLRERVAARSGAGGQLAAISLEAIGSLFSEQLRSGDVPRTFESTVARSAALLAAGQSAAQAQIPARVARLSHAAAHMLMLARLRAAAVMLLIVAVLGVGGFFTARHSFGRDEPGASVTATGDLRGKLVDAADRPVAGATVRLYRTKQLSRSRPNQPLASVNSADDGSFTILDLPAGDGAYLLCFKQQPVFMHADRDGIRVVQTQSIDLGTIKLIEGRY
jgi:RNA polymerase sigma factor (sigma-70 family)